MNTLTFELAAASARVCVCVCIAVILTSGLQKPQIYDNDLKKKNKQPHTSPPKVSIFNKNSPQQWTLFEFPPSASLTQTSLSGVMNDAL